jgi:hypothetical protein
MIAYVDSSVLLRSRWGMSIPSGVAETASRIIALSRWCLRTLERLRLRSAISDREVAIRRESSPSPESVEIVSRQARFSRSRPMLLRAGTLDMIHLVTAFSGASQRTDLVMATHDAALGTAARSCGLRVIGTV